jgi:hypothetical protein
MRWQLATVPADVDAFRGAQCTAKQVHEVVGCPAVGNEIDGRGIDVVVLILRGFFFEGIDENLQVRFRNRAEELFRRGVVQVDHGLWLLLTVEFQASTPRLTGYFCPFKYETNFWFSRQMNSINSLSSMMRWLTRTVHGFVYAFGSSIVTSISRVP